MRVLKTAIFGTIMINTVCLINLWVSGVDNFENWMTHWYDVGKEHPRQIFPTCHHNLHRDF